MQASLTLLKKSCDKESMKSSNEINRVSQNKHRGSGNKSAMSLAETLKYSDKNGCATKESKMIKRNELSPEESRGDSPLPIEMTQFVLIDRQETNER